MTSRERMITAMFNREADMVPVAPDMSNMIPCLLTGKPFWDIYLYQDPPLWQAYIHATKHYGIDGWLPDVPVQFDYEIEEAANAPEWKQAIVQRTPDRIYTRMHANIDGKEHWTDYCIVYYIADPPTWGVPLSKVGLPDGPPEWWEDVVPRTQYKGMEAYHEARRMMGEHGVIGMYVGLPCLGMHPEAVYEYYDNPDAVIERCERQHEVIVRRAKAIAEFKPDFLFTGVSGLMINNPEPIFRKLGLPTLQAVTKIAKDAGIPSQVHCCGPEYHLVKIAAEESDLSSINPLEIPPMGDCDLARIKREFGSKIGLMGNIHTTEVMLKGTPESVRAASLKAIDDAGENGGFILSTGDQCGRDTPPENIRAMVETAREYGRY
ncbi:MAG: uroporphyrinogen decarboxylase family protein [Armatimonadota bacterium]